MTEAQRKRLETKIKRIRSTLAAEKRRFGGYDDSRGLRYVPPSLYLKLQNFRGGLVYTRWFARNFPDDIGFPDFLFEWAVILFMNGKTKEAKKKVTQAYFSNIYLFDKFFGRPIKHNDDMASYSNVSEPEYLQDFPYSAFDEWLGDFAGWLGEYERTAKFQSIAKRYIDAQIRLKTENDPEMRHYLVRIDRQLLNEV